MSRFEKVKNENCSNNNKIKNRRATKIITQSGILFTIYPETRIILYDGKKGQIFNCQLENKNNLDYSY